MGLLIWWLSQEDCELIVASPLYVECLDDEGQDSHRIEGLPAYIDAEFWSRIGRAGRNRPVGASLTRD